MPIVAERMLDLIDIASKAVDKIEIAREKIEYIGRDTYSLRKRLNELKIEDERLDFLMQSIIDITNEVEANCVLPSVLLRNLGFEKARFEINLTKNKSARQRMQMLRDGIRSRPFVGRTKQSKEVELELNQQDDKEYYKQRGEELHPELGPCDGEPCRKCEEKQKQKTENNNESDADEVFIDDGIHYSPADEVSTDEWLPKTKE